MLWSNFGSPWRSVWEHFASDHGCRIMTSGAEKEADPRPLPSPTDASEPTRRDALFLCSLPTEALAVGVSLRYTSGEAPSSRCDLTRDVGEHFASLFRPRLSSAADWTSDSDVTMYAKLIEAFQKSSQQAQQEMEPAADRDKPRAVSVRKRRRLHPCARGGHSAPLYFSRLSPRARRFCRRRARVRGRSGRLSF